MRDKRKTNEASTPAAAAAASSSPSSNAMAPVAAVAAPPKGRRGMSENAGLASASVWRAIGRRV